MLFHVPGVGESDQFRFFRVPVLAVASPGPYQPPTASESRAFPGPGQVKEDLVWEVLKRSTGLMLRPSLTES
jgi:hypothetical protein